MRTLAIMNLKGGTAKTVTAINTAAILARDYGQRVLLVDADCQANLTDFMSCEQFRFTKSGLSALLTGKTAHIYPTVLDKIMILPADESLMALDVTASAIGKADPMKLADFLDDLKPRIDWCVIDCPPAFSAAATAALIAADDVVIPVKIDAFGIRGMASMTEQIRNMTRINPELRLAGVLPTMFYGTDRQRAAENELRSALEDEGIHVFDCIRRSNKVDDSTFEELPLIYSSPKSAATRDYKAFVARLVEQAEGGEL